MQNITITYEDPTGKKTLLETASFIALGNCQTHVKLEDLTFILDFRQSDTRDQNPSFKASKDGEKTLTFVLIDWNNPIGTGFTKPLKVGNIDGKDLSVVLFVKKIGNKGGNNNLRIVTISFYINN